MNLNKFNKKIICLSILILLITSILNLSMAETNTHEMVLDDTSETSNFNQNELELYSKSSILIDANSGQILYEYNAYEQLYPASITKLMTAILTLENCELTDVVTVDKKALLSIPSGYTTALLVANEELTVEQLLNVLLIPSANDAANVLAYHIAGSIEDFAVMMNEKATELGCTNTHFVNPSGIHDDNHYTTAYDMALIGKYANTFDTITEIASKTEYSLPNLSDGTVRSFKTTNNLITSTSKYYYEYATGLKTGYTDKAKSCIVAKAVKDDIELICVILYGDKTENGENQRELDCKTLFEYGFNNYNNTTICTQNDYLDTASLSTVPSIYQTADIVYSDTLSLLVNSNNVSNVTSTVSWNTDLQFPIMKDTVVGTVTYTVDGNDYSIDLLAGDDIYENTTYNMKYFFYVLIVFLIIMLLITIFKRKRKNRYHKKSRSSKEEKYFRHSFY